MCIFIYVSDVHNLFLWQFCNKLWNYANLPSTATVWTFNSLESLNVQMVTAWLIHRWVHGRLAIGWWGLVGFVTSQAVTSLPWSAFLSLFPGHHDTGNFLHCTLPLFHAEFQPADTNWNFWNPLYVWCCDQQWGKWLRHHPLFFICWDTCLPGVFAFPVHFSLSISIQKSAVIFIKVTLNLGILWNN